MPLVVTSWIEQRNYLESALRNLPNNHPIVVKYKQNLQNMAPRVPSLDGYTKVNNFADTPIVCDRYTITFNKFGEISYLIDTVKNKVYFKGPHNTIQFLYRSFNDDDYATFIKEYGYCDDCPDWFILDFGKPNMKIANPINGTWLPNALELWTLKTATNQIFQLKMECNKTTVQKIGAPETIWLTITIPRMSNPDQSIALDLQVFNKTPTRLPEAMFYSFNPVNQDPKAWRIDKLGQWIDPLDVVLNGTMHYHAFWKGVTYNSTDRFFAIDSLDAATLSVGSPNPFPTPFVQPDTTKGIHFCLYNNIWGTNYAMWYPFIAEDAHTRYRFNFSPQV